MTHPLTDDKCRTVADSMTNFDGFPDAHDHMRAGADWQLEQVIQFMEKWEDMFGGPGMIFILKDAMRPQLLEDN